MLGTPEFIAPEIYEEHYDTQVDIYAFGMCVLEMITQDRPYVECENQAQIYNRVMGKIEPLSIDRIQDEEVTNFIRWCIKPSPQDRPTANELLHCEFLSHLEDKKNDNSVKIGKSVRRRKVHKIMKVADDLVIPEEEDSQGEDSDEESKEKKPTTPVAVAPEENKSDESKTPVTVKEE